jgi:FKBP-type peptidyl-prolyl cis-trans isomerase 2
MVVEKEKLNLPGQYEVGQILYAPTWQAVTIIKVTDDDVHLDTNHELAGKNLIFDITIKEIK